MKPIILFSPAVGVTQKTSREFYFLKRSYSLALSGAGAVPMLAMQAKFSKEYAQMAQGLILTDSDKGINPGRYNKALDENCGYTPFDYPNLPALDSLDLCLCKAFLEAKKPILGIGRGMNILNIALGGTLTQLKNGQVYALEKNKVEISKDFSLSDSGNYEEIRIRGEEILTLGEGLKAFALWEDGNIAAIQNESGLFFGVKWHPEVYKSEDLELYEANKNADTPCDPTDEEKKLRKEMTIHKAICTKYKSGLDSIRPNDNMLFNRFVELCKGGM